MMRKIKGMRKMKKKRNVNDDGGGDKEDENE